MPPGLYLHVPFCATVCPYCDFAVLVGDGERRERFVDSLIDEIRLWGEAGEAELRGFDTIYFGGGTPSMLEREQLERVLDALREELEVTADAWTFLEANPEDVTRERLRDWVDLGVRTVSLGVQSFDDDELRFLGRLHDASQSRSVVELALAAGFETVSLDLIYGLPIQTEASWRRNLEVAIELEPEHLSCYQLTVHEGTAFGVRRRRGELTEMPDEGQGELFLLAHRVLGEAGYDGYEVSSFARAAQHRSRHNSKYWDHTPYLGLGPSAHSFVGTRRWWNRSKLAPWQRSIELGESPVAGSEELTAEELVVERLMLGMRTRDGVDLEELSSRYGVVPPADVESELERSLAAGHLTVENGSIRPTLEGLAIAESLARTLCDVLLGRHTSRA